MGEQRGRMCFGVNKAPLIPVLPNSPPLWFPSVLVCVKQQRRSQAPAKAKDKLQRANILSASGETEAPREPPPPPTHTQTRFYCCFMEPHLFSQHALLVRCSLTGGCLILTNCIKSKECVLYSSTCGYEAGKPCGPSVLSREQ